MGKFRNKIDKMQSKMRVLYLTMNPNRMSTTRPTEGWLRQLIPKGLSPVLVSDKAGEFNEWALQEGIPAYEIPLPLPDKLKPLPFLWLLFRLYKIVKRHKIQLIHCNEQNIYPIGGYLSRICRLPVVVSVHFVLERDFCRWAFSKIHQPQRIFFISHSSLENCRKAVEGIVSELGWRVLYNGIDTQCFRPDQTQRDNFRQKYALESKLLIGAACAFRPLKQLEHLFEAVSQISMPNLKVLLAGFSVPEYVKYSEELLKEGKQKLGDRFLYLGQLQSDELIGFYNALDIFVNTSSIETFSMSVIEAMACGCPVMGYPSKSAVSEAVLPDGGEIVEQDRRDKLVEVLTQWLNNPQKLAIARIGARKQAEKFNICKIADRLWEEYQSLLLQK